MSLFSGIGGLDLAAEWAGFETVLFCERDPYCQKVLRKHWPDVPIISDIREVNSERVQEIMANSSSIRCQYNKSEGRSIGEQKEKRRMCESARSCFAGTETGGNTNGFTVDVISGGFPCQPFSHAGKRIGKDDDRFLWPEMLRVIREIKPRFVVAENVPGLLSIESGMVFERVLSELESCGYETLPLVYPASGVGAPHKRDRVFIVAHTGHSTGTPECECEQKISEKLRAGREGQLQPGILVHSDRT